MCRSLIVVLFHLEKGKTEAENSQLKGCSFRRLVILRNCQNYQLHYSKFSTKIPVGRSMKMVMTANLLAVPCEF